MKPTSVFAGIIICVVVFIGAFLVAIAIPSPTAAAATYTVRYVDPVEGCKTVKATNVGLVTSGVVRVVREDGVVVFIGGNFVYEKN